MLWRWDAAAGSDERLHSTAVTGAWCGLERTNLITGPARQNCAGLCLDDLKVHRAMMCSLPSARNHTRPPHTPSFSCCRSHVNTCSLPGGMGRGIRLAR